MPGTSTLTPSEEGYCGSDPSCCDLAASSAGACQLNRVHPGTVRALKLSTQLTLQNGDSPLALKKGQGTEAKQAGPRGCSEPYECDFLFRCVPAGPSQ